MGQHVQMKHGACIKDYPPVPCTVQALFDSNEACYPVVVPSIPATAGPPPLSHHLAESAYCSILDVSLLTQLEDHAHLNPFLAKYNWLKVVDGLSPCVIHSWVSLPSGSEPELNGLTAAVEGYYNSILIDLGNFGAYTTILRWIQSSKM